MVDLTKRLLEANKDTYLQVTTGDTAAANGTTCSSGPAAVPAMRDDHLMAEQGEPPRQRLSYWCPRCQPGPHRSRRDAVRRDRSGRTKYHPDLHLIPTLTWTAGNRGRGRMGA